jgi:endoribonuclease Dicer
MPTRILARRITAYTACKILHMSGELDDNLQPIGKEGFRAIEPDWENFQLDAVDEQIVSENMEPRPGTTKRRQYYYKRIADAFSDCRPKVGTPAFLYSISLTLQCPIPEEQNTRGRKIYPPEDAQQGFGILTLKRIPKISAFPIFTRSGEVRVALELIRTDIILDGDQIGKINMFINYTFTNVLRLQKYLMLFDADAMDNCFFIVPTIKIPPSTNFAQNVDVDWNFLEIIKNNVSMMPQYVPEELRKVQPFDARKFQDSVVMPWYRNQDQPQYFYVAEICKHLSPDSSFPGENYSTFKEYYLKKYGIDIQNARQPLLDVDHTSARLNFLTPRYVNRKGVALPTSSEETKKAKRENLEQKQILVPELCTIHPFPASLWRTAVCLPCILYRINALLLADEIRKEVSFDLGLGRLEIENNDFQWPVLDFGWSLADVLKRSREIKATPPAVKETNEDAKDEVVVKEDTSNEGTENVGGDESKTANEILEEADLKLKKDKECLLEIGTWSNEMAEKFDSDDEMEARNWGLPDHIDMCSRRKCGYLLIGDFS